MTTYRYRIEGESSSSWLDGKTIDSSIPFHTGEHIFYRFNQYEIIDIKHYFEIKDGEGNQSNRSSVESTIIVKSVK